MPEMNVIINQMIMFALLLSIGYIGYKIGILKEEMLDTFSTYILKIALPCMILISVATNTTREQLMDSGTCLLVGAVIYAFLFLLGFLSGKIGKLKNERYFMHVNQVAFGNTGFLGIPLILSLFGEEGILYLSLYTILDQILIWTVGLVFASKLDGNMSIKDNLKTNIKKCINPSTIALFFGILMVTLNLNFPKVIEDTLSKVGSTSTVISMVYIGIILATIKVKDVITCKPVYLVVLFKMIIAPLVTYLGVTYLTNLSNIAALTFATIAGLPSIIITSIFAKNNDSDYEYGVSAVFITTILSIITIPTFLYIINTFL